MMKKIIYLLMIMVFVTSCDDTESPVFTGDKTLVYFSNSSATLDVIIDDTGSVDIPINTTTLQDEDIQVTVEVVDEVNDVEQTTAADENFDFDSQVTIPAGEYTGFLTVNGIDQSVETDPELIVFRITDASGFAFEDTFVEVSIKQVCPLGDGADFLGDYTLEQQTPIHPANGVLSFENQTVTLVNDGETEASTRRAFEAVWIEAAGFDNPTLVSFDLSCNNIIMDDGINTGLTCDQESNITLGKADTTGTYDANDDSSFTLILAEYVNDGGCGVPQPLTTEFLLTKE